jgi:hypothetical protein
MVLAKFFSCKNRQSVCGLCKNQKKGRSCIFFQYLSIEIVPTFHKNIILNSTIQPHNTIHFDSNLTTTKKQAM